MTHDSVGILFLLVFAEHVALPSKALTTSSKTNMLLFFLQNSFSSVFHMEYEELGEVLDAPQR